MEAAAKQPSGNFAARPSIAILRKERKDFPA
jgi:hypothetical protein